MSKSVARVRAALQSAGTGAEIREMDASTRTAAEAAAAVGCCLDQIVKSIVMQRADDGEVVLLLTAGGHRICPERSAAMAGGALVRVDAEAVRARTGFAIGGVAPVGHLSPLRCFLDPRLLDFDLVWAAAGTPRHVFAIAPADLQRLSGAETVDFTEAGALATPGPAPLVAPGTAPIVAQGTEPGSSQRSAPEHAAGPGPGECR